MELLVLRFLFADLFYNDLCVNYCFLWNIDLEIGLVNISIALLDCSTFAVRFINMLTNQLREIVFVITHLYLMRNVEVGKRVIA